MTDARMPSRWLTDPALDCLTDRAWRTFAASLMWSNGEGTDGNIPVTALRFLHPAGVNDTTADELIAAGRWAETPEGGYQVTAWSESQSLAADVVAQRARKAEWIRNKRAEEKAIKPPVDTPVDVDKNVDVDIAVDPHVDNHVDVVSIKDKDKDKAPSSELKLAGTNAHETKPCTACQRANVWPNSETCPEHGEHIA